MSRFASAIAGLVLLAGVTATLPARAERFTITITEWCPYMCTEQAERGFTTEIVEAAFKTQGHDVAFRPMPWLRALDLTRKGKTDGSLAPAKAEAPDFIFPETPVSHQQMCFFTGTEHDWRYEGVGSLPAIRFGFLANLSLPGIMEYIRENQRSGRVQPIPDDQFMTKNFKKIDRGRIDALIDDRNVVYYYMKQQDIEAGTYRLAGCLADESIYLGLSPAQPAKSSAMIKIYQDGFHAISANGELARILSAYGMSDAAPKM